MSVTLLAAAAALVVAAALTAQALSIRADRRPSTTARATPATSPRALLAPARHTPAPGRRVQQRRRPSPIAQQLTTSRR